MSAVRKPLPAAVTADLIARAIVASARSLGQDPIRAMRPGKGTHRRCLGPARTRCSFAPSIFPSTPTCAGA